MKLTFRLVTVSPCTLTLTLYGAVTLSQSLLPLLTCTPQTLECTLSRSFVEADVVAQVRLVIHNVELETEKDNMKENRSDPVQFIRTRRSRNADVLPGLGTAILRTPQPRQTLACLHRRDPRKGCSTPARFNHFRDFIICAVDAITYGLLPEGILAAHHPSVVGLTPGSSIVTSHRQVRDNSVIILERRADATCDHCHLTWSLEVAGDTFLSSLVQL
ncbi:hypothetical protein PROFUN_02260 [Planoprotostelium fungivorum]|uniref:Uncharacterized protein n=1 Tax=Planoprotostelium fungivorum TaxID=1890364 RepID=A0A2P6NYI0_9EUKA|nr:hypothetical protein PROFUN_02260 [Planoprotostelium fungivorum]